MPSFVLSLLLVAPILGLAKRWKAADVSTAEDCPLGFICTPAACDIQNSNGLPGLDCACQDGFEGSITWKLSAMNGVHYHTPEGVCKPARCGIVGTEGDGPDCQCKEGLHGEITWSGPKSSGECMVEAKALFTEGEQLTWNHDGKSFKCCVSSAGRSTILQDMNSELPKYGGIKLGEIDILEGGARLKPTGCGYMFGPSYHNGMKRYSKLIDMTGVSREEATCPVPIAKVLEVSGASLVEVMEKISS